VGERQSAPLADVRGQAEPASIVRRPSRWLPRTNRSRVVLAAGVAALRSLEKRAVGQVGWLFVVLTGC
jgi:hypothetical protein